MRACAPGSSGSRLRKLVLAAGVEPATSRLRSACTAIVLRQHPNSASPETSARVGSTGRGSALCRGALSLKTLAFTQRISRAHPFGRERISRAHPFGRERAQDSDCDL